ncbi:MAG: DUF1178 family protein [Burkholderiaceae bacterium]|nr:MAG: DUF1178 family protein [Burkholderiaceae bacterium]
MKVFDLHCIHDHRFEGWFSSAEEFERQASAHLIQCPLCGISEISKLPSAARLNLGSSVKDETPMPQTQSVTGNVMEQIQKEFIDAVQKVLARTEDVGEHFAEEARRIHYKETPKRDIRGTTSIDEARALADEGIEVQQIVMPGWVKEPSH